jgi:hypothetical protein
VTETTLAAGTLIQTAILFEEMQTTEVSTTTIAMPIATLTTTDRSPLIMVVNNAAGDDRRHYFASINNER